MRQLKKNRAYLGFIAPGFILYSLFVIIPIFISMFYSLHEWSGLGPMKYVGLKNFEFLFQDARISPIFFNALKNNLKYTLCVLLIITPIQFLLAYLLYIKIPLSKNYRFLIFLPYVISSTIVSFFATMIFDPNIGFLNSFFDSIGLSSWRSAWFGDPSRSFVLMILVVMWQGIGTGMMIFYANMQDIPKDIIEASLVDGAGEWKQLVHIVLPMSIPASISNIVLSTIWSLAIFDIPFILGGPNGGVNNTLDFVNLVFYRYTFGSALDGKSDMGFGASISLIMFFIIFTLSTLMTKFLQSRNRLEN